MISHRQKVRAGNLAINRNSRGSVIEMNEKDAHFDSDRTARLTLTGWKRWRHDERFLIGKSNVERVRIRGRDWKSFEIWTARCQKILIFGCLGCPKDQKF